MKKLAILGLLTGLVLVPVASAEEASVRDIGSRLELFVDDYLIEKLDGARLQLHHPQPANVVIEFDRPWEGIGSFRPTVIFDGLLYHMYYRGFTRTPEQKSQVETTCYATSTDGIHWTKPNLGIHRELWSINSSWKLENASDNNVLFRGSGFAPILDTRPGVPRSERFKALKAPPRLHTELGAHAYVSEDGAHWRKLQAEPVIPGKGSHSGEVYWSESEQLFVQYLRLNLETEEGLIRSVRRSTSPDFVHWSEYEPMTFGGRPPTLKEHIYTVGPVSYFRAPHICIVPAARFMPGRQVVSDEEAESFDFRNRPQGRSYWKDCSDTVLMTTRGGNEFDRTFMEAFVRPGPGLRNWVTRTNYPGTGIVPTGPDEISSYIIRHYGQPSGHIRRYTLRTDGFASVHAPYEGGELLTRPLIFEGKELVLNFSTSAAGSIRVEVQGEDGEPVSGYSLAESHEIIGDKIEGFVRWKNGQDLSSLEGKPVRLRFVMKDADLYSIRFR